MKLKIILSLISSFWLVQNLTPSKALAASTCPAGEIRYREGGPCEKETPFIHDTLSDYPLTCQNTPFVSFHREEDTPPYDPDKVWVTVNSDIMSAELGGFGPSLEAISSKTPDVLAALYPFNALFDKPPNTSPFNERESFRTYWRLLSSLQQANAKASFFEEVQDGKINNQTFKFYNSKDQEKEWQIKDLYNKLPNCIRKFPVCEDYTEKYNNLNINIQEAYDALVPFNFDNVRGYEVIKYDHPDGRHVVHMFIENLPYIAAINQGLLDTDTGLLNTLSPSWLNTDRQPTLTSDKVIPLSQEGSLYADIRAQAKKGRCGNPPDGKYLSAPPTFPEPFQNPGKTLEQTFEIDIETHTEIRYDKFGIPYTVWISKGSSLGSSSVQVLNNPKQEDISQALAENQSHSMFNMFTSSAVQEAYNDKNIHAPSSFRDGKPVSPYDGSVDVGEKDTFIPRKGGEPHVKLCELRNQWLIPASLQRNIDCENLTFSEPVCGNTGQPPTLPATKSSCTLSTNSSYGPIPDLSSLPSLKKMLESAGSTFNVPPGLILSTMYAEGMFNPGKYDWTEQNVQDWSKSCAQMSSCNPITWVGEDWTDNESAVQAIDPSRVADQCNLLDTVFVIAKYMQATHTGSSSLPNTCFGIPLNKGNNGSVSCTTWDESDIATGIKEWESGNTTSCFTLTDSCRLGGGMAAACPNGDTCETKDNWNPKRPSHFACMWNATQHYK